MLSIFWRKNVNITERDIVATHRLGKPRRGQNRNVIVKFLNRKNAIQAYKSRFKLKKLEGNLRKLYFIENLCLAHKTIFNRIYRLYKSNIIFDVWTYHGHVFASFIEDEDVQIELNSDIDYFLNQQHSSSSDDSREDSSIQSDGTWKKELILFLRV